MTEAPTARAGLDAIADPGGIFSIVAMDQRNTLRRMFAAAGHPAEPADLRQAKTDVAAVLTPVASAILLDPSFGVPAVQSARALAPTCGLLVAAEPEDRGSFNGEPRTHRDPAQDAAWVRSMGGDAVKFLIQLRPDRRPGPGEPDIAAEVIDVVRAVVADCRATGVPAVVENLIYPLPGEDDLTPDRRADLIIEAARILDDLGVDLLKLEYPGSAAACRRLAEVITGPWAVLSAGVPFGEFQDVLRISCDEGGASGFIAGRALWREVVGLDGRQRTDFLETVARPRLDACLQAVDGRARPWRAAQR
jgi:tagatose-1,6-bisphosphate aldolase